MRRISGHTSSPKIEPTDFLLILNLLVLVPTPFAIPLCYSASQVSEKPHKTAVSTHKHLGSWGSKNWPNEEFIMRRTFAAAILVLLFVLPTSSWRNGGESQQDGIAKFGTHDYIALKGYELAGPADLQWITDNMNVYFLGTEAPDVGAKISGVGNGYHDTGACHCILFNPSGVVSHDRAEIRVQEEFDKAKAAKASGDNRKAAFYAGAMAHYLGDLSQFCHIMGPQSHWGSELKTVHTSYETVVDKTVDKTTRKSSLLDSFIQPKAVTGNAPVEIALGIAEFTEKGDGTETPGKMHSHYKALIDAHKENNVANWDAAFRKQTGENVNYSVNAVAKLLKMI